jgi:subtilisin family serine protease
VTTRSFVAGASAADQLGHGTHCAGTAVGHIDGSGRRYGVAFEAALFAGRIFGPDGFATDTRILAGLEWALRSDCHLVSLSLETPTRAGAPGNGVYDVIGRRCLDAGTLLIAAAGNDSRRPQYVAPVSSPADSPSILAVGALDAYMQIAPFSNSSIDPGAVVDVVAPGIAVYSSLPGGQHGYYSGTSQATPHVTGTLALWHQATNGLRARELWAKAVAAIRPLSLPVCDVGFGLIQVPC